MSPTTALLSLAFLAAAPELAIEPSSEQVERFARLDVVVRGVDATTSTNPCDESQGRLDVFLQSPSGETSATPGFFQQDYEHRRIEDGPKRRTWLHPTGPGAWRARITPTEIGTYRVVARWTDARGATVDSPVASFECVPPKDDASIESRGFVRVSRGDPRFLETSDGRPFFAVGHNVAFIGGGQEWDLQRVEETFDRMAANGANFTRIWIGAGDWALGVESRKSCWGRSWGWRPPENPPIVPAPDDADRHVLRLSREGVDSIAVNPCNAVAMRPSTAYVLRGRARSESGAELVARVALRDRVEERVTSEPDAWRTWEIPFTTESDRLWLPRITFAAESVGAVFLDDVSLREAEGGPELLWEADLNRRGRRHFNPMDAALLDRVVEAADRHGIYVQLCVTERNLYMDDLVDPESDAYASAMADARNLLRYVVARWGYSPHVAVWEYWNEMNPGRRTDRFYIEVGDYLSRIDMYGRPRATSTWSPKPSDWSHASLDIAESHYYLNPSTPLEKRKRIDEVDAVLAEIADMRRHAPDKPVLLAEFGVSGDNWTERRPPRENGDLTDFHNGLWASSLSGASGTCWFWWWQRLHMHDAYAEYRPLTEFLDGVPWTTDGLQPLAADVAPKEGDEHAPRVVGLLGKSGAYFWIFDPESSYENVVEKHVAPRSIADATVALHDIPPGRYLLEWWDTRRGEVFPRAPLSHEGGDALVTVPRFERDLAGKLLRVEQESEPTGSTP